MASTFSFKKLLEDSQANNKKSDNTKEMGFPVVHVTSKSKLLVPDSSPNMISTSTGESVEVESPETSYESAAYEVTYYPFANSIEIEDKEMGLETFFSGEECEGFLQLLSKTSKSKRDALCSWAVSNPIVNSVSTDSTDSVTESKEEWDDTNGYTRRNFGDIKKYVLEGKAGLNYVKLGKLVDEQLEHSKVVATETVLTISYTVKPNPNSEDPIEKKGIKDIFRVDGLKYSVVGEDFIPLWKKSTKLSVTGTFKDYADAEEAIKLFVERLVYLAEY